MISAQRLQYLNKNRQHGDVAKAIEQVNKKAEFTLTKAAANEILKGKFVGVNGFAFCNELEKIITKREKALAKEAAKYTQDAA